MARFLEGTLTAKIKKVIYQDDIVNDVRIMGILHDIVKIKVIRMSTMNLPE